MAEQEKPQGPKRRSSHKARRLAASGAVVTNNEGAPKRPARTQAKGAVPAERAGGSKPAPVPVSGAEEKARGWVAALTRYLTSVKAEFIRVTWPTGQELKLATTVVVATLTVLTLYLYFVNTFFTKVFERLGG